MAKELAIQFALTDKATASLEKITKAFDLNQKTARDIQKSFNNACKQLSNSVKQLANSTKLPIGELMPVGDTIAAGFTACVVKPMDDLNKKMELSGNKTTINNFKALGISIKDNNGHLKNQKVLFKEITSRLKKIPDEKILGVNTCYDNIYLLEKGLGAFSKQANNLLIPKLNWFMNVIIDKMSRIRTKITPIFTKVTQYVPSIININKSSLLYFEKFHSGTKKTITLNMDMMLNPAITLVTGYSVFANILAILEKKIRQVTKNAKKAKQVFDSMKNFFTCGNKEQRKNVTSKIIPKQANLKSFTPGKLSLVGENGSEFVNLPRGTTVINNKETKKIVGTKDVTININIAGNMIGNNEFINNIKQILGKELKTALAV